MQNGEVHPRDSQTDELRCLDLFLNSGAHRMISVIYIQKRPWDCCPPDNQEEQVFLVIGCLQSWKTEKAGDKGRTTGNLDIALWKSLAAAQYFLRKTQRQNVLFLKAESLEESNLLPANQCMTKWMQQTHRQPLVPACPDLFGYGRLARASWQDHLSVHLLMCSPGVWFLPAL